MKLTIVIPCMIAASCLLSYSQGLESDTIRQILNERIEKEKRATAIVVGIVDEHATNVIACGTTAINSTQAANGETVFEIGSVTKVFTSLLLADMVQKGEVKLDDPISKYLPSSVKVPTRNGKQITLVDLATHSSGLPRLPDNFEPADNNDPYVDYSVEQMYDFLSNYTLKRDIGAKYEYSNFGVGLLGHILALRAGTSYEALVQERICRPLGMTSTAITLSPAMKERLAQGHNANGRSVPGWNISGLAGCGGVRSTANDLLKLASACLNLEKTPLGPAITLAETPRHETDSKDTQIGLAWHITKRFDSEIVWHNGATGGYHSYIGLNKQKKLAVVVLANTTAGIEDVGQHILEPQYALHKVKNRKVRAIAALEPKLLDRCVGRYQLSPKIFINVRRTGDHLQTQLTGQAYLELFPESATEFFLEEVKAEISFATNTESRVTSLTLHQNGIDQTAEKISDTLPKEPVIIKLDPGSLDAYTGKYKLQPGVFFIIRHSGDRLLAQLTGQNFFQIFPSSETEFFYKVVDAQLTFKKNAQGEFTDLILHQNGIDQTAHRVK
jgi:D-alanyl-D-alanine-carboxypeptidase/D-alanyl-D-alanine-endopeptidase